VVREKKVLRSCFAVRQLCSARWLLVVCVLCTEGRLWFLLSIKTCNLCGTFLVVVFLCRDGSCCVHSRMLLYPNGTCIASSFTRTSIQALSQPQRLYDKSSQRTLMLVTYNIRTETGLKERHASVNSPSTPVLSGSMKTPSTFPSLTVTTYRLLRF
jgi:hypothetical protein